MIKLIPGTPETINCKVYPLTLAEQEATRKFLEENATVGRTCYHTCVHLAILRICDTRALDAADRSALTARCGLLFMDVIALCLYDTRCVMTYVRVGPQEMTSYDVMTGQLLYDEGDAEPRGVVVFKLWKYSVETSVSTWSPIQDCLLLSTCESSLRLITDA
jgi:hypothetical protein